MSWTLQKKSVTWYALYKNLIIVKIKPFNKRIFIVIDNLFHINIISINEIFLKGNILVQEHRQSMYKSKVYPYQHCMNITKKQNLNKNPILVNKLMKSQFLMLRVVSSGQTGLCAPWWEFYGIHPQFMIHEPIYKTINWIKNVFFKRKTFFW